MDKKYYNKGRKAVDVKSVNQIKGNPLKFIKKIGKTISEQEVANIDLFENWIPNDDFEVEDRLLDEAKKYFDNNRGFQYDVYNYLNNNGEITIIASEKILLKDEDIFYDIKDDDIRCNEGYFSRRPDFKFSAINYHTEKGLKLFKKHRKEILERINKPSFSELEAVFEFIKIYNEKYTDKNAGTEQISTKFSDRKTLKEHIKKEMKRTKLLDYFTHVEFDNGTDFSEIKKVEQEIEDLPYVIKKQLNDRDLTLRYRGIRYEGKYYDSAKHIILNKNHSRAFIHELAHYIAYKHNITEEYNIREIFSNHIEEINKTCYNSNFKSYLKDEQEIFARCVEIWFSLKTERRFEHICENHNIQKQYSFLDQEIKFIDDLICSL